MRCRSHQFISSRLQAGLVLVGMANGSRTGISLKLAKDGQQEDVWSYGTADSLGIGTDLARTGNWVGLLFFWLPLRLGPITRYLGLKAGRPARVHASV